METPGLVPVGEPRYVHFLEGTTLLPGKWDGPIQVMAIEHKPDNMTVFIRPYLPDYDSPEELGQVPTQKKKKLRRPQHHRQGKSRAKRRRALLLLLLREARR